jgi:hypothetical protein
VPHVEILAVPFQKAPMLRTNKCLPIREWT